MEETKTVSIKDEEQEKEQPQSHTSAPSPSPSPSPSPTPPSPEPPYTTLTTRQKRHLRLLIGLATTTSPLTATIYFPLLPLLQQHFHTTSQAINQTLTIYIIFQALSPALFGPLSDTLGRRPIYLLTLLLYLLANVGLAANAQVAAGGSYAALLVLRAVQSLGASAAYAVSYGVVADVCVPSERGAMLGPVSVALNLGACVGPVVGGAIAYASGGFEWVFWALVVVGAVLLGGVGAFLPETARAVVGNGEKTGRRRSFWEESWWSAGRWRWQERKTRKENEEKGPGGHSGVEEPSPSPSRPSTPSSPRNSVVSRILATTPLAPLRILCHRSTLLALWMHGSFYAVDYVLVAAIPSIFQNLYHFNDLQLGLAYLPRGVGIIVGGYVNGKLMDRNYRAVARQNGWTIDSARGDDMGRFPIELARSRGSYILLALSTATLVGYGWAVDRRAHCSVALVLQFVAGFWGTSFYTTYNALVVDVFPESPSSAAAAASIVRCAMAAAAVAILQPLIDAAGGGWYFTVLGLWSGLCGILTVFLIQTRGMAWRVGRTRSVSN
ncbi:major facilitator superfamily domain-containing protein [Phyllosticta capitalensis]|uniref:Major facilitator superfamily domain-containing protein n=1 Tax=Phyllosticta capitalensis TaxID=121624 RepID=A0ABR1Z105_9PEZI